MGRAMIRTVAVLVVTVGTLLLSRCISAEERDLVKYDPVKDEFQMLMVLTDIRAGDADDLAYLEGIYRNRDHWITPVAPGMGNMVPLLAMSLIRLGDRELSSVNIFASRPTELAVSKSTTSLKEIRITPGTFFLQGKKLGYYQAITVPGKTIDDALAEVSGAVPLEDFVKGVDAELERRTAGGKTRTWAELKEDVLKRIVIKAKPAEGEAAEAPAMDPLTVVDIESLKKLKQAAADKSLKVSRQKQALVLSLPLVANDAAEFSDLVKQSIARVGEAIKESPEVAEPLKVKAVQAVSRALTVAADGKGLTVSVDILVFAEAAASLPMQRADMNNGWTVAVAPAGEGAAAKVEAPDVVAYLREKKIPLDETLTAEQIIKDFNAGTLKGHPSAEPVKPGEGIAKPKEPPNVIP